MVLSLKSLLLSGLLAVADSASIPRIVESHLDPGVSLSFKETRICETTPGVKSYSGYVTLLPSRLAPFEQNLFWIFFEARNYPQTAPLTLWLQGGPGLPSIDQVGSRSRYPEADGGLTSVQQAFGENGPCKVNPDSNSTTTNPRSWNAYSNMLYIDQPVQTGYSYDNKTPGSVGLV